jgi:orotidine-5'-phosphate decarboxylase
MTVANPIYCAVDTPDIDRALALGRAIAPHVGGLKLGMEFFYACGADGVRRISAETGLPIFLDLKLHDIPNTVAGGLASVMALKPAIVNVHAQGGPAMLRAASETVKKFDPACKIIAVTVLTSLDAHDLEQTGLAGPPAAAVARLAQLTRACGLDGIVCSSHEVAAAHAAWPEGYFVVPGLRPAGSDAGDQKRVMTPKEALGAGASVLIIGRPITDAADPAQAAADIVEGLRS